jgi:hypothetical protein
MNRRVPQKALNLLTTLHHGIRYSLTNLHIAAVPHSPCEQTSSRQIRSVVHRSPSDGTHSTYTHARTHTHTHISAQYLLAVKNNIVRNVT